MTYHRQSFLWRGFCLNSPFSSLMNQWIFRSLSPIDLQHEMCLVVFRQFRNHQQERVSLLLLHISASQKMAFLSFSFFRTISLSVRPLQVNLTLKYRFQMILIAPVRSVLQSIEYSSSNYPIINSSDRMLGMERLKSCVNAIMEWAKKNRLQCNPSKTEIIHFLSRFSKNPPFCIINIGDDIINLSNTVRDLGVMLDSVMNLRSYINSICKSSSLAIRNIGRVRKYLSKMKK